MKKINIAIDGHSSTGKGTLAKALARELGYVYIDTGAMYRAVTLYALRRGWITDSGVDRDALLRHLDDIRIEFRHNPATGRSETILNGENVEEAIRDMRVSAHVSRIAAIPEVRRKLVSLQQAIAARKGVVMDGRDIGTVVMPDAELKIFMTARPDIRARRRYNELIAKGRPADYEEVYRNLVERDRLDSTREASPLVQAPDARLLDNSDLTPEQQLEVALKWVKELTP
ncbi:MAG: (d)CMP kinase [Chlorobi bacterium]|nr:(d)CMP kinase [Chlorobiota bacterium]